MRGNDVTGMKKKQYYNFRMQCAMFEHEITQREESKVIVRMLCHEMSVFADE